jgi:hypothetical protein
LSLDTTVNVVNELDDSIINISDEDDEELEKEIHCSGRENDSWEDEEDNELEKESPFKRPCTIPMFSNLSMIVK